MRSRTYGFHSDGESIPVSGRLRKDIVASLLTTRFLLPALITVLALAFISWLARARI